MSDTIAVIQARMASTRFPGKSLAMLYGRPMLEWVIDAAKRIGVRVVVTTTEQDEDDAIADCTVRCNVDLYRSGCVPLMLYDWYLSVADEYDPEYILRICGDQPLLSTELARVLLALRPCDYACPTIGRTLGVLTEYGVTCELFSTDLLRRKAGVKHLHMQHCTSAFYSSADVEVSTIAVQQLERNPFRGTVDYPEDLRRLDAAIRQYGRFPIDYWEVIECLCTSSPSADRITTAI